MSLPDWKEIAEISQPIVAPLVTFGAGFCLAVIVGALLAYRLASRRYGFREGGTAHIESSADISFIGQQDNFWIVELKATLANKGRGQHKVQKFWFNLDAIHADDPVDVSQKWNGQVNFGNEVAKGSFIPRGYGYCVIGPSVTATYSYVARVPDWATFLILHCWFDYGPGFSQWMEKTVQVPLSTGMPRTRHDNAQFAGSREAELAFAPPEPRSSHPNVTSRTPLTADS